MNTSEGKVTHEVKTIRLASMVGSVNCYLVRARDGFVLIDTGFSNKRVDLEKELTCAGCKPGNLRLIVLTHGDTDHSGNCAYLRTKYGAKIAVHRSESEVVRSGNMLLSRKNRPFLARIVLLPFKLAKTDRFTPDIYPDDGTDLSEYGFDARVIHIPGHSMGSIGILPTVGDPSAGPPIPSVGDVPGRALFCGDLLVNTAKPAVNSVVDDMAELNASIEKLKGLEIETVYPGHGRPFRMQEFMSNRR